jgi:hypothetical protein
MTGTWKIAAVEKNEKFEIRDPQDMWMPMDERAAKPETRGLRPGW